MSDRSEQNRKIAEWLEPMPTTPGSDYVSEPNYSPGKAWVYSSHFKPPGWRPRSFECDEAANALVLEKMWPVEVHVKPEVKWIDGKQTLCGWIVSYFVEVGTNGMSMLDEIAKDPDRKTAICEAALRLIESKEAV